jgi:hypothetical protein
MDHSYWQKQSLDEPLFPDIIWSRPQTKAGAGKLAILGGNEHGFNAPGVAYNSAVSAGVGVTQVIMPDGIRKIVKNLLPDADFAPSTPSGSFSRKAIDQLLQSGQWADGVLLAGDFGRNSETAMMLESFIEKYTGPLTITKDAVEFFKETPGQIVDRQNTIIVLSLSQLQKLFINTPTITPITLGMNTQQLVEALHDYTEEHCAVITTMHNELLFVAHRGLVSTTKSDKDVWRVETAARASVFWLQNPDVPFEAATTAVLDKDHE